jgi:hypothetical protein
MDVGDLKLRLNQLINEKKNKALVKKATRLLIEFETGFGNERMFVSSARRLLGDDVPDED